MKLAMAAKTVPWRDGIVDQSRMTGVSSSDHIVRRPILGWDYFRAGASPIPVPLRQ
jgi:hypothetical protein